MAQLLNYSTNAVEDVPDEHVTEAVASGGFGLPKGSVNVVDGQGRSWSMDGPDARKAFMAGGFRFETGQESAEREAEKKFGDRPVEAAAEGAARGASLGLSDMGLKALGVSGERLGQVQKRNQVASIAGEVGGTAASLLIPGLGEATGPGLAAKLGARVVEGAAEHLGEGLAGRVLARAAGGAVEGIPYGISHVVNESVLGNDPDLTAEKLLSASGGAALLGGAAGALGGVIDAGLSSLARRIEARAEEGLSAARSSADAMAEKKVAEEIAAARGKLGAETQKGSRQLEVLERESKFLSPEQRAGVEEFLSSDAAQTVREGVVGNVLHEAPGQLDAITARRQEFEQLAENRAGAEAKLADSILSPGEAFQQVRARAARYGAPMVGRLLGGGIGAAVGGPIGVAVGAFGGDMVGSLAGGQLRPSLLALKRMAEHPSVQKAFWGAVKDMTVSAPEALGRFATPLAEAAAQGPQALLSLHAHLMGTNPDYVDTMASAGFAPETDEQATAALNKTRSLAAVSRAMDEHDAGMGREIGRFLGTQSGTVPKAAASLGPAERLERFTRQTKALAEIVRNPDRAVEALAPGRLGDVAPATGAALSAVAMRAATFLDAKAPKNPNTSPIPALARPWKPSEMDVQRWDRYVRAVQDPRAVLADLRQGRVSQESVDALRAVYPKLLQDMQAKMMERVAGHKVQLSYRQRTGLSTLMGAPIGGAGNPQIAIQLQQAHAAAQQQEAQKGSAGNAKRDHRSQTDAQRIEGRSQSV